MYLSVLQLFPKSIKETNNGGKLLGVIVTIIVIWAVFINLLASLYTGWKDFPQWINSRNPLENQPESTISTIIYSSFLKCITLSLVLKPRFFPHFGFISPAGSSPFVSSTGTEAAVANSLARLAGEKAPQAVAAIGAWAMKQGGAPPVNRYTLW